MTGVSWTNDVHQGDAVDVLQELPASSVHATVTDPPYGLAFMGRDWDAFEPREYQTWCEQWAREVKRVLKPGGHLLAFSGNRTHHRLFVGVEDAGFEVRDTITSHHGNGFPKGLSVEQEIDWPQPDPDTYKHHSGSKTALKPATEFVVLARKPLEGTVAETVQKHGTGALNIDGCRVPLQDGDGYHGREESHNPDAESGVSLDGSVTGELNEQTQSDPHDQGRYPSNVVFDETAARELDRGVGELSGGHHTGGDTDGYGESRDYEGAGDYTESGGPSRYFYTSKASHAERTLGGRIANGHPTVKPLDLMEWLVRLVTREGQTVLDPFAGTGTTGMAAKELGRRFVLVEQDEQWADVARVRCGLSPIDASHIQQDDAQATLTDTIPNGGDR